jgi:hypothetical protein
MSRTGEAPASGRWSRSDLGPLAFVWAVWAFFSWRVIDFVRTYGVNFPYYDEWELMPALAGTQPITLKWLWSQHNEHRIFIPRLIYLAVTRLTRYDFRAGMFFDALILIASAAALILTIRRIRGRTEYTDAFFALVVLNLGQTQNLTNSFQVAFVAGTLLTMTALVLSMHARQLGFRSAIGLGICAMLLPLVGGHGLALVPALSLCVVVTGWRLRNEAGGKWRMLVVWALAVVAIALTAYYFVGYTRPPKHRISHSLPTTLDAAVQFLSIGAGLAAKLGWPQTRYLFLALTGGSALALVAVLRRRPEERGRAIRLLLFLAGMVCLALGISWARSALWPGALFESRYVTLATPFWCAIYFVWELVDWVELRVFVQTLLLFCATVLAVANLQLAAPEAAGHRDVRQTVLTDVRAGVPLGELVRRHYGHMYYGGADVLTERLRMLRAKHIGVFKLLKD